MAVAAAVAASVDREPEITERRSPLVDQEVAHGARRPVESGRFVFVVVADGAPVVSAGSRSRGRVVVGSHPGRRALLALQPPRERLVASHLRASRALLGRTRDEALASARVLSASPALERASDGTRRPEERVPEDARSQRGVEQRAVASAPFTFLDGALHGLGDVASVRRAGRLRRIAQVFPVRGFGCEVVGGVADARRFRVVGGKALLAPPPRALSSPRRPYLGVDIHHPGGHHGLVRANAPPSSFLPAVSWDFGDSVSNFFGRPVMLIFSSRGCPVPVVRLR